MERSMTLFAGRVGNIRAASQERWFHKEIWGDKISHAAKPDLLFVISTKRLNLHHRAFFSFLCYQFLVLLHLLYIRKRRPSFFFHVLFVCSSQMLPLRSVHEGFVVWRDEMKAPFRELTSVMHLKSKKQTIKTASLITWWWRLFQVFSYIWGGGLNHSTSSYCKN